MSDENKNFLVSLPRDVLQALDDDARNSLRLSRSKQLEFILRERYNLPAEVVETNGKLKRGKKAA